MAQIRILSDQVANQIAAGEVVERPASVIKELVENSLDAGATRIEVEFKSGGKHFMRVEDNGCGMSRDDALLSLERHATSKIKDAKDLDKLDSMGFRGEAVPSIASVSRFELQTKEEGAESGADILVDGGRLVYTKDCGMPTGTRIAVSQLFKTVPARRKFLKSDATESAHIIHQTRLHALAYPTIGFTLLEDGRQIFRTTPTGGLRERVAEIFGKATVKNLIPLEAEEGNLKLNGLIGRPGFSKASRHEMLVFVNNRPVENRTLGYALVESYYGHIPKGRYPVAFLFLNMPSNLVDVNVHPAKREVRFRNEAQVRGFAVRSILQSLKESLEGSSDSVPKPKALSDHPVDPPKPRPRLLSTKAAGSISNTKESSLKDVPPTGESAPRTKEVTESVKPARPIRKEKPAKQPESSASEEDVKTPREKKESGWRFIGWTQGIMAIFETDSGITLLDTRAASRRVWYERMVKALKENQCETQALLLPVPCEFDPVASAVVENNLDDIRNFGFDLSPFGRNFFRLEGIPAWLKEGEAEDFLREIVATLRKESGSQAQRLQARESIARRGATKAASSKMISSQIEVEALAEQLFATKNPLADIDGRPCYIEMTKGEIDRRFHRRAAKPDELF